MILHHTIKGEGEPIVFLHTGLQTGKTDYIDQWQYFSEEYQVILPDLRGHGQSLCSDFTNYIENAAIDIKETLDHLKVNSAHIVGCSIGGLVGIVLTRLYPEKVKSLSISGILPKKPNNWEELHNQQVKMQRQLLRNEEQVEYFNELHYANWRELIYLARDEDWYPFDQTKTLSDLQVPVLYMVGEANPVEVEGATVYSDSEHFHSAVIPFAGHMVHVEQPELYTSILEKFLVKIQGKTM